MACAIYSATRGLVSYHTEGESYGFDFDTTHGARPSARDLKEVQTSLSGVQETQFYGEQRIWEIATTPVLIGSAEEQLLLEFLRSTADGQTFELDPYGRVGAEVNPLSVERSDSGYSESPFQMVDGRSDYVQFSFRVLEV